MLQLQQHARPCSTMRIDVRIIINDTCTKWLGASRCVAVWASMRSQLMLAMSPLLRWPRSVRKSGPRPSVEPQDRESALTARVRSMILCAAAMLQDEP